MIALMLPRNKLQGAFNVNLREIQFLFGLCLGINSITGEMQHVVSKLPKNLLRLSLAFCKVSGWLPSLLPVMLPILAKVQLSGSLVSGSLPESIGDLKGLTVLSLGETRINGSVPKSLSSLSRLWFLDFEALGLHGDFSIFHNLTSLEFIHLSSNRIKGEIPLDMGLRYPYLRELLLQNNMLTGTLPRSIGLLKHLTTLNIAKNQLTGEIPAQLGSLNLQVLIISSNRFSAFETGFVFNYSNLNIFLASDLSVFKFDVQHLISKLLPAKQSLIQLDISNSNLQGYLPDDIYLFKKATFLKFGSNRLTGGIPDPNDNLPFLTLLDLRNNNLTGSIPTAFSRLLMLQELDLRGNSLLKGDIDDSFLKIDNSFRIQEREKDTCPLIRFAHNDGMVYVDSSYYNRKYCQCKEHFFGQGGYCYACMKGAHCPGYVKPNTTTRAGSSLSRMFLNRGFWPFPNEENVSSLHQCPTSIYYLNLCVPKGCGCTVIYSTSSTSHKMNRNKIRCNGSCLCAPGHMDRFCSKCKRGYYRGGIRCFQCPNGYQKGQYYGTLFGSTLAVLIVSLGVFLVSRKNMKFAIAMAVIEVSVVIALVYSHFLSAFSIQLVIVFFALAFSSYLQRCTGLFKTAIFYIQIMDTLVSMTDIWPKTIYSVQMYASSSINFEFSSLACAFPSLFSTLSRNLFLCVLPIACPVCLMFVYTVWKLIKRPDREEARSFNLKCRKFCLIFIDVAYFPIVASCISVLAGCKEIDNVSFMKNYVWIDCGTLYHTTLTVIALIQLILYVIGVPFFIYCPLLYRYREKLESDESNWLGHLIIPYRPELRRFMEVIMVLRRLTIALFLASFPANEPAQTQLIAILLIVAIIFQALAKPFARQRKVEEGKASEGLGIENAMEIFMLSSMLLAFICVGLSIGHNTFSFTSKLFLLTVFINGLFIISICYAFAYRLFSKSSFSKLFLRNSEKEQVVPAIQQPLLNPSDDRFVRQSSRTSVASTTLQYGFLEDDFPEAGVAISGCRL